MPPHEALYGRKCRTPICWSEIGERKLIGPEMVKQTQGENYQGSFKDFFG